jgi:hypothetical protein
LLNGVFGDDEGGEGGIDGIGRAKAGEAAADDQHIGEEVRELARVEGDEIAGREHGEAQGGLAADGIFIRVIRWREFFGEECFGLVVMVTDDGARR